MSKTLIHFSGFEVNDEQLACIWCGYIHPLGACYEIRQNNEEYPICPKCGEDNSGGYSSFVPWYLWSDDQRQHILSIVFSLVTET